MKFVIALDVLAEEADDAMIKSEADNCMTH